MAGQIILEDIRAKLYDTNNYRLPNFDDNNYFNHIPEFLVEFINVIIKSHKNNSVGLINTIIEKITAISSRPTLAMEDF